MSEGIEVSAYLTTYNGLSGYLEPTLEQLSKAADHVLVSVAEKSDDGTLDWCRESDAADVVITHSGDWPEDEPQIRRQAYKRAKEEWPGADWMLAVDDDEVIAEPQEARELMRDCPGHMDLVVRKDYHMWEGDRYRADNRWKPLALTLFVAQNLDRPTGSTDPEEYSLTGRKQREYPDSGPHCGRFPERPEKPNYIKSIPVLHFGWYGTDRERFEKLELRDGDGSWRDEVTDKQVEVEEQIRESLQYEPLLKQVPDRWRHLLPGREESPGEGSSGKVFTSRERSGDEGSSREDLGRTSAPGGDEKLAAIILDGLGPQNVDAVGMRNLRRMFEQRNGEVLGCSTIPHTAASNPMIWGGYSGPERFWVEEDSTRWSLMWEGYDREAGARDGKRMWRRGDFETAFIWDVLDHQRMDATALQVPITLPPYSFNTVEEDVLGDHWFPDTPDRMERHGERMPELIERHAAEARDLIAASIQLPDKWMHHVIHGEGTPDWARRRGERFDRRLAEMVGELEEMGYDWMLLGDHGSPVGGVTACHPTRQLLPRHQKEAIVLSSLERQLPRYTGEVYQFLLDHFDVEEVPFAELDLEEAETEGTKGEVRRRLERLGYT